ncbi:MAG: Crp/Fnr family transcriptional regulator [Leadbetterella sp.]
MIIGELFKSLSTEEKQILDNLLIKKEYPAGHILIKEGSIATKHYLIEKGYCRSYFIKDGEDITDFFYFENSFASDFASFCSKLPSLLNLVCEEPTTLYELNKTDLEKLYSENLRFSEIGRITAEYSFLEVEERMRLLHTESLEVKYNWMLEKFPSVFQRVPQYQIATFLGAKPQSLSRIRAKIAGKIY